MTGAQQAYKAGVRQGIRQERIRVIILLSDLSKKLNVEMSALCDGLDLFANIDKDDE